MTKKNDENSFVFYRSFYDAIQLIQDEVLRSRIYDALCAYAFHGTELADDADTLVKMVFVQAKPQIDANIQRRIIGKTGGRTAKKQSEPPENEKPAEPEDETAVNTEKNKKETDGFEKKNRRIIIGKPNVNANVNVNDNVNENVNVNVNANQNVNENGNVCLTIDEPEVSQENGADSGQTDRPTVFIPPALAQVQNYAAKKQLDIDAEYFVEYYTANGWMTGKEAVRDWKALLRSWARQEKRWNQREGDTQNVNDKQKGDTDNGKMEPEFGVCL